MRKDNFVIGVDFGTDSVRSVLTSTYDGREAASSVFAYPRWRDGLYCDPAENRFRQHPKDYLEGLEHTIKACLRQAGIAQVGAISVDTTGSTPAAVNEQGIPLSLLPGFEQNPNAMFMLWKDHTAVREAEQINLHAKKFEVNYLENSGGTYSAEWYWAKLLHVLREDRAVADACFSWAEHCDWIPFLLTGGRLAANMMRSRCAAGHKALWSADLGGYPPTKFFNDLDPWLRSFADTMLKRTYTADQPAGFLCPEWGQRLGLTGQVVIGIGALDAHMGAVGGQIEPYHLSKVMGTSTCDILVAPKSAMEGKPIKGICGQVDGSVIPGMIGLEAGQSAFGDTYAWFRDLLAWPLGTLLSQTKLIDTRIEAALREELCNKILSELSREAAKLSVDHNAELTVDWLNGRRAPDANQHLKAAITGLSLGSGAPRIFRALVESTCFGAKAIIDRFNSEGVPVKGLIGIGGVAKKSPYIMQMMADVLQMPIRISKSEQTCALGAAMFAATADGTYPKVEEAMAAMGAGFDKVYEPAKQRSEFYEKRHRQYQRLAAFTERSSDQTL
jgi:L-ribulokinase